MGALLNEVREQAVRTNKFQQVLDSLSADDQKDLLAVLDDHSIQVTAIHKVLKNRGISVSVDTLRRFRQR